jgi:formate hydrogenlyase transcriptional activator
MDNTQNRAVKGSLLVVDDDLSARQTMETFLTHEGYEVRCAPNGQTALMFAREDPPELILLDIRLPDLDGFRVCRRLKEDQATRDIPVIFISALDEIVDKVKGFGAGGVDYITKPFQGEEMLARVETHLNLRRFQKRIEVQRLRLEEEIIRTRRAEETLLRSEVRFRNLVETTADWVWETDANGVYTYASPRIRDLLGYEPEEVIGKTPFDFMPPEERERVASIFGDIKSQAVAFRNLENINQHREGRLVVLETNGIPFFEPEGALLGYRGIDRDITERKRAGEALQRAHDKLEERVKERTAELESSNRQLEERLAFESLLAEISARFISLPVDQVEEQIRKVQGSICGLLGYERSSLWLMSDADRETLQLMHIYPLREGAPSPEWMDAKEFFPWSVPKLLAGEVLIVSKMGGLPSEADRDRESWHSLGVKSSLVIPLSAGGGEVFGAVSFALTRQEQDWGLKTVSSLHLVAQVFANALMRKRAYEELRSSEERLSLAAESAQISLWSVDLATRQLWNSESSWDLLGLDRNATLTEEVFFAIVHSEDRERLRQSMEEGARSGKAQKIEYRIVSPDGRIRWLASHARLHPSGSGGPGWLMGVSIDITERKQLEEQLQTQIEVIEKLKERLQKENVYLQEEIKLLAEHTDIVGESRAMKKILLEAEQVAETESTVLLMGETGTGKELLARAIHRMSARKDRPMVTVNCASLPPTLIESELFGRERGAYTGAMTKMIGRFEIADGSTLFLDEIGEIPLELQSKLLRVLEEGRFERLGSTKAIHVDVRIIAATNRNLGEEVKAGRFRSDLFYRLNVFPIVVPPLRERAEDIPLMVWTFVREFQKRTGKEIESIPKAGMDQLMAYSWPGNVRELKNVVERAMIVSRSKTLVVNMVELVSSEIKATPRNLEDVERSHIVNVLESTGGRIGGKGGASEALGMKRSTLYSKMKKLGISRDTRLK